MRLLWCFLLLMTPNIALSRSILRTEYAYIPHITTRWLDGVETYSLKSWYIEEEPTFKKFEAQYFFDHLLPREPISLRHDLSQTVDGQLLSDLADHLVQEIMDHKKTYTHFTILKQRDFNRKECSGLLILKYKKYRFVLKLFLEKPESFVRPFSKGWQPGSFFILGGGINRYLSGFTRIKNLETIEEIIAQDPVWAGKIDFPRKWFWLPTKVRWFQVTGRNIGLPLNLSLSPVRQLAIKDYPPEHWRLPNLRQVRRIHVDRYNPKNWLQSSLNAKDIISQNLPNIYGIIADEIKGKSLKMSNKKDRNLGIELSRVLTNRIDPNIDNFKIEKRKDGTKIIVLIDTEHFPTMIGLKDPLEFDGYFEWYFKIACKYFKDCFFRTKKERLTAVYGLRPAWLSL